MLATYEVRLRTSERQQSRPDCNCIGLICGAVNALALLGSDRERYGRSGAVERRSFINQGGCSNVLQRGPGTIEDQAFISGTATCESAAHEPCEVAANAFASQHSGQRALTDGATGLICVTTLAIVLWAKRLSEPIIIMVAGVVGIAIR